MSNAPTLIPHPSMRQGLILAVGCIALLVAGCGTNTPASTPLAGKESEATEKPSAGCDHQHQSQAGQAHRTYAEIKVQAQALVDAGRYQDVGRLVP